MNKIEYVHLASEELKLPLDIVFADSLPEEFTPPDELVEGVIANGEGSILYGDSNSGKTFFVIDMACGVASGVDWFGRKTEQGMVVYLAAESPASVRGRLQAYQRYYDVRVPNFVIVQNPINLFDGHSSTKDIIYTVKMLEDHIGVKARLVVGDTLARLSAGANENSGQDMGVVIKHCDNIRNVCDTHFMLIHHCGKNAAAGARGWSGVRAAVDTEIEVTDSAKGRCAEITKQRDLSTKGERIGFKLEPIKLGLTKWGSPATSCVVLPADAPLRVARTRPNNTQKDILNFLSSKDGPIKKIDLVKKFTGKHSSDNVYRQAKALVLSGRIRESEGDMLSAIKVGELAKS